MPLGDNFPIDDRTGLSCFARHENDSLYAAAGRFHRQGATSQALTGFTKAECHLSTVAHGTQKKCFQLTAILRGRASQASVAANNVNTSGSAGRKIAIKVAVPTVQVRIKAP